MIINIDKKERFSNFNLAFKSLKMILGFLRNKRGERTSFFDGIKLNKLFRNDYPALVKDHIGNSICTSCKLCEDACPTNAISISKANLVNFPATLETGEAPTKFILKVDECIKCELCTSVCYVDAISLTGKYDKSKVDLVALGNN